ncbi:MAG: hypothetical protein MUC97_01610 [Bernardetiaceae bacterium]|jgi:hypothetical protein|nr:hypothetical protein [Bernardetiaceae bacterium]
MRNVTLSIAIITLFACGGQSKKGLKTEIVLNDSIFNLNTELKSNYVVEVWYTNLSNQDSIANELKTIDDTLNISQLVIKSRDLAEVVQITQWKDDEATDIYFKSKIPNKTYKAVKANLVSFGSKGNKSWDIGPSSSIQYSEFIMLRKNAIDTLSNMVKSMTSAMANAQATLDFITTFHSDDSTIISLLGIWNTKEGFEIFAKQNTWGEKPYWEPYAKNDHHMFDVVISASKQEMRIYK